MTRVPVDTRPSAQASGDGRDLDESLAEYDEHLRQGVVHPRSISDVLKDPDADSTVGFVACLTFLERVWPRSGEAAKGGMLPARIGRFEIQRVLGYGGFGVVYLAHDPVLNRPVALKVPRLHSLADAKLRERFHREARAAATLDHPNIVPIYETGQDGPIEYIASAYCDGPPLDAWLRQQTVPIRPSVAAALVATLAEAAQYSHSRGVLHQDLKPGNVLLVPVTEDVERAKGTSLPFTPRITDFGLARLMDDCPGESAASAMLGTPAYMAPEQLRGADDATGPHTDVYALGVLLYELLTGRPPFQGS